ncbi:hypothetical protein MHYP_G00314250 [Metynnis hypsauchen]
MSLAGDKPVPLHRSTASVSSVTRYHWPSSSCCSASAQALGSRSLARATASQLACHRRHLRKITGHVWPHSLISNRALYEKCECEPLSRKVERQRWSMLGHILRMEMETPARRALEFAVVGAKERYQGRRGRHCTNLLELIRADIKQAGLGPLQSRSHLNKIAKAAQDSSRWRSVLKD